MPTYEEHQTRAIAALAIAEREVAAMHQASEWADQDYTLEYVLGEVQGLAEYVRDPGHHATASLGFTG